MITTEIIVINDIQFKRTYSDKGFMIQKVDTDEVYSEAVDVPEATFEYVETDEEIATIEINKEKD